MGWMLKNVEYLSEVACLILVLASGWMLEVSAFAESKGVALSSSKAAESYIDDLLPFPSENREKLKRYLSRQGIELSPRLVRVEKDKNVTVHWSLAPMSAMRTQIGDFPEYVDSIQIQDLSRGQFLINKKKWVLLPLISIETQIIQVESLLADESSRFAEGQWLERSQRLDPWPREKGGVFLLAIMYSLYLSQDQGPCKIAQSILKQLLLAGKDQLLELRRCDKENVELAVKTPVDSTGNFMSLNLNWIGGEQERIVASEENLSTEIRGRRWIYYFDRGRLKEILFTDSTGQESVYTTDLASGPMVTQPMFNDFRLRYQMLERIRNAGAEWGFSCVQGCYQQLVSALIPPRQQSIVQVQLKRENGGQRAPAQANRSLKTKSE